MEAGVAAAAASGEDNPVAPQPPSTVVGGIRGTIITYVHRMFGFFDLLPLSTNSFNHPYLDVELCLRLGLPPSPSAKTYLMDAS